ncbi:MAG: PocR ligand-binding domain-containing protein [Desulfosarcina sp.]|nr:PocR ligand-binding domain-containing protein [Desulfosarcina sp.]
MELTDLLPLEKWTQIENEIYEPSGLESNVFNTDGIRITDHKVWVNRLCPAIKATDKGQSFICAVAHMNLANQAKGEKRPVIEECDAGLMKIVVPIFVDGNYIGAVGACGLLPAGGEVDAFLVNKMTDIDEADIEALCEDLAVIEKNSAEEVAQFIWEKIEAVVSEV